MEGKEILRVIGEGAFYAPFLKYNWSIDFRYSNESCRNLRVEARSLAREFPQNKEEIQRELKAIAFLLKAEEQTKGNSFPHNRFPKNLETIRLYGWSWQDEADTGSPDSQIIVDVWNLDGEKVDTFKDVYKNIDRYMPANMVGEELEQIL